MYIYPGGQDVEPNDTLIKKVPAWIFDISPGFSKSHD